MDFLVGVVSSAKLCLGFLFFWKNDTEGKNILYIFFIDILSFKVEFLNYVFEILLGIVFFSSSFYIF